MPIPDSPLLDAFKNVVRAKSFSDVSRVATTQLRALIGADGCTIVLREGDLCFYVDEDAIAPLWKGRRFPLSACVSGWVITKGDYVVIEDIRSDHRIPQAAYLPTFVRSMAMVPIGQHSVGALGAYWASRHEATPFELECLRTLADAVAMSLSDYYHD